MTETYKKLLDSYRIIERVKNDLKNTTEEQLIKNYKGELNAINDYWSNFSGDCAGHAHTCLRLKINCIEKGYHLNNSHVGIQGKNDK
jgi:hypothetical protein